MTSAARRMPVVLAGAAATVPLTALWLLMVTVFGGVYLSGGILTAFTLRGPRSRRNGRAGGP